MLILFAAALDVSRAPKPPADVVVVIESNKRGDTVFPGDSDITHLQQWMEMIAKNLPMGSDKMQVAIAHAKESGIEQMLPLNDGVSAKKER